MSPILALAIVAVAGIAVTRLPRLPHPSALRLDVAAAAGLPLVVVGILLGPALHAFDAGTLRGLAPAQALGIAWIGALFGAGVRWRYVRRIPRALWLLALGEAAAVLAATAAAAWLFTRIVPALRAAWQPPLAAILSLGAIAVVTGPAAVLMTARAAGVRRAVAHAFEIAAWLDTAFGAVAFTLALALYHPRQPAGGLLFGWVAWIALALGSGVLVGMLFLALARLRPDRADLGVALIGALLLGAGVGYAADLSPFVIAAVAMIVIVHRAPSPREAVRILEDWEHPIYAVFLILAGAAMRLPTPWVLAAAVALAGVRVAARWAAVRGLGRAVRLDGLLPPNLGLAGVAQGGVAVALAMNFFIVYGTAAGKAAGGALVTTVLVALGLAQLAAPMAMQRALAPRRLTPAPAGTEVTE